MSIRILPENEIKQAAASYVTPPLLFSNPKNLYQRRAARLRELAQDHPLANYLLFAAAIADAQLELLETMPIPQDPRLQALSAEQLGNKPLDVKSRQRDPIWRELLTALLAKLKPSANDQMLATIEWLEKAAGSELENLADKVLAQEFAVISSDKAVFVWAALSLYWLQLVQQIPHNAKQENTENLHICPVCGSAPTASMIHFGAKQGLRYLHCSLCESEWNMVRNQCTNCGQSSDLDYWSFDEYLAAIRSESCGNCHSYLKALYQEKDPKMEVIADDLASIFLDLEMEKKGFMKSGLNPFVFPPE
ncbi:formate dehydrogenase accessory protein FdhE [Aggregatibacter actinomycetemcomitans]|uniref:formate dehydrogenase accessory protein FdhE n=1 Tax=Aggregatibacter actinomycetemcomitans TaxID=714 RepID=UPI00197C499B|nr:formate dehydrogenase accessory protein FdhE [Aggregatibacter actinomycetemcomitans]MBN6068000.1 formate dehydrogenase accessory protein FdhE [Aggregatibacter actinomycetemcomitans]MBN6086687.1 formate dehydrogenase accessory protein FdhE [Aggregatibacter actinomycetemcomitans]